MLKVQYLSTVRPAVPSLGNVAMVLAVQLGPGSPFMLTSSLFDPGVSSWFPPAV